LGGNWASRRNIILEGGKEHERIPGEGKVGGEGNALQPSDWKDQGQKTRLGRRAVKKTVGSTFVRNLTPSPGPASTSEKKNSEPGEVADRRGVLKGGGVREGRLIVIELRLGISGGYKEKKK